LARAGKCPGRGAMGDRKDAGLAKARSPRINSARAMEPSPTPHCVKKWRRVTPRRETSGFASRCIPSSSGGKSDLPCQRCPQHAPRGRTPNLTMSRPGFQLERAAPPRETCRYPHSTDIRRNFRGNSGRGARAPPRQYELSQTASGVTTWLSVALLGIQKRMRHTVRVAYFSGSAFNASSASSVCTASDF
jgi:hypothetical protein